VKTRILGRLCPACLLNSGLGQSPDDDQGLESCPVFPGALPFVLGDYELLEAIGQGGMGIVYRARQKTLNRLVAIKMLRSDGIQDPTFVQRFREEAELIAQLHHPHIVAIHEVGNFEGHPFFSMDLVDGTNLAQVIVLCGPHGIEPRRCARWLKSVSEAAHHAHQQGIIHRDLKPSNVLIDELDEPHITDFGVAKRLSAKLDLTAAGQIVGSPYYLAPEQAAGRPACVGSDVYSLGAILYHMLTGRPPFQGDSIASVLRQVAEADPILPRLLHPGTPRDLEAICLKALEKDSNRRYASALELAEDLGRYISKQPTRARPLGPSGRVARWCRRQPVRAGWAGTLLLAILLGVLGIAWFWQRAERERDSALRQVYAGDLKLAQLALENGDLGDARRLLNKHRPSHGMGTASDRRGWEWRYLWALSRDEAAAVMTRQSNGLAGLRFSPDGSQLAVRQPNGNIDLWDWPSRTHTGTLTNQGWQRAFEFSPRGDLLASANRDAAGGPVLSLWDTQSRRILQDLPQPSAVASLAFSPDGALLATYHLDAVFRLWSLPSGSLVTNLPATPASNNEMRVPLFSPDGTILALGEMDGRIRLLRPPAELLAEIPTPAEGNGVSALAFSPDGKVLASGYGYSVETIHLWNTATGEPLARLEGHRSSVSALLFAADGRTLYSASADQTLRAWDIQERRQLARWQGHTDGITGLALAPEGRALVSCAGDGTVRVWNLSSQQRASSHVVLPIRVAPYGAPFTHDSRRLLTASATFPVTFWDVATARAVESILPLGTNHHSVALSPDDRLVAAGSLDGVLQIWDRHEHRLVRSWQINPIPIFGLRFLDQGRSLVSLSVIPGQVAELRRWSVGSWEELPFGSVVSQGCYGFDQSPDRRHLALSYFDGPVRLWNYLTGQLERTFESGGGWTPQFSPDGLQLIAAVAGHAKLWEVASGRETGVLESPANGIVSAAFSPDGRRVVTGSGVGMSLRPAVHLWDPVAQRDLLSLHSDGAFTGWTQFSPDGNTILALSWHGLAELWRAPSWETIEAIQRLEDQLPSP
jgi:WD40 repeat protein/tRNA A-37 threonylcarbamoyl transferase component Bud32